MLKTLHYDKHILNEEECRSVGKARYWCDELVVVIVVKGAVQETLGVLEEYKGDRWYIYNITAERIKSKLCLDISLCRHTSPHF